jgi:hypothetical protein
VKYNIRFSFYVGYSGRDFSGLGYNRRGFSPVWDISQKNFGTFEKIFCCISKRSLFSHCIPHGMVFLSLYPTPQKNLLQCIPQRIRFYSIVGYSGET